MEKLSRKGMKNSSQQQAHGGSFLLSNPPQLSPDTKDTTCKQDFRNGTFVTLNTEILLKTFSHTEHWDQSDCLLSSAYEVRPIRLFVLIILLPFRATQACLLYKQYLCVWLSRIICLLTASTSGWSRT